MKFWFVIICPLFTLISCKSVSNYLDHNSPVFVSSNYTPQDLTDSLVILNYNIEYGMHSLEVSHWIKARFPKHQTRLIFLQEVSENDAIQMADILAINYVYYPISYDEKHQKNFGNAILTDLSIIGHEKILLDHAKPFNGRKRSATYAQLKNGKTLIHAYSLHLETIIMPPKLRKGQVGSLNKHITSIENPERVIIAGDFNCISSDMRYSYQTILAENDLIEFTQEIEPTLHLFLGIPVRTDLIFGKGFRCSNVLVHQHENWSDHSAVELSLTNK